MLQILVVVLGLVLVVAGLFFAVGGFGQDPSGGGFRAIKIEGPAWLLLVAIGAGLVIFGAVFDWGVDEPADSPALIAPTIPTPDRTTTSARDDAPTTTSPQQTTAVTVSCEPDGPLVGRYAGPARNETHDLNGRVTVDVLAVTESCSTVVAMVWSDGLSGATENLRGSIGDGEATLAGDFQLADVTYAIHVTADIETGLIAGTYEIRSKPGSGETAAVGDGTFTALRE